MNQYMKSRSERAAFDGYKCVAIGMHHENCPGRMSALNSGEFCTHHVKERQFGGGDEPENLRTLWNGPTGIGRAGCHNVIHEDPVKAELLGLLDRGKGLFGAGLHLDPEFWDLVDVTDLVRCWPWQGHTDDNGYGVYRGERCERLVLNARPSDQTLSGCHNSSCCNPLHLSFSPARAGGISEDDVLRHAEVSTTTAPSGS